MPVYSPNIKLPYCGSWQKKGKESRHDRRWRQDAHPLKRADIGVGIGITARMLQECSRYVLADANFATIVAAVEEGAVFMNNIRKPFSFCFPVTLSESYLFLFDMLGFIVLKPAHLLWINLITDAFPGACPGDGRLQ